MREEHCDKTGCEDEFVSSNYGVRTTPRKEYLIVTGKHTCPDEDMMDKKRRKVRVVRGIEELKGLKLVRKAGLTEDEVIAVVWPLPCLGGGFLSLSVALALLCFASPLHCPCIALLRIFLAFFLYIPLHPLLTESAFASRCCTLGPCSRCFTHTMPG
jgi:hypothetical protein